MHKRWWVGELCVIRYLDKMIIMTYDLKIAAEGKAAHHSGLWTAYSGASGDDATRNQVSGSNKLNHYNSEIFLYKI